MAEQFDPRALWSISYGLYVVTSAVDDRMNGQIANTVIQACAEPPRILVAINKGNYTHEFIDRSGVFAASVLERDTTLAFIGRFGFNSGRDMDKLEGVPWERGVTGSPLVTQFAVSVMEARVYGRADAGTHTVFLADVVAGRVLKDAPAMTYADYHARKGRAPKAAPTYRGPGEGGVEEKKGEPAMKTYVCQVCGYVYDPADGDPDGGIAPGTAFEDLPDDWVCPVCGAEKSQFEPED